MHILDSDFLAKGIGKFALQYSSKFERGAIEHNPGDKEELALVNRPGQLTYAKEEVMDLWSYLHALEVRQKEAIALLRKAEEKLGPITEITEAIKLLL